jgi:hypothetical protein
VVLQRRMSKKRLGGDTMSSEQINVIRDAFHQIELICAAAAEKLELLSNPPTETQVYNAASEAAIRSKFPEELANKLTFNLSNNVWFIKPKEFLGNGAFPKISDIVKSLGGKYVSDKQNSHFEVKKV